MADIKVFLIFEMLGRPAEHLKKTLSEFVDKIGKEEGIELKSKEINEPKQIEETKEELYTSFAEVEVNIKDLATFFKIIFVFMPSHIEIIEPEDLRIKNFDLNTLTNELTRRLHQYDELAKRLAIERQILVQQLTQAGIQPAIPMPEPPKQAQQQEEKKTAKAKTKKTKKTGKKKK